MKAFQSSYEGQHVYLVVGKQQIMIKELAVTLINQINQSREANLAIDHNRMKLSDGLNTYT
ncbi:MAG: hypothetical protein A2Z14_07330 [Chloroflexi bacterium RBG_16_48_8]|nr:MAG: hypothetical protein A2Z14_07330 [Chloroflexi bacterium RBG_16_48_8]